MLAQFIIQVPFNDFHDYAAVLDFCAANKEFKYEGNFYRADGKRLIVISTDPEHGMQFKTLLAPAEPEPAAPTQPEQAAEEIQEPAAPALYYIIHTYDELLKDYYKSHGVQFSRDWPERTAFVFNAEHSADAISAALLCTHEYTRVEGQPALVAYYWHEREIIQAINNYCWENSPQSMPEQTETL